MNLRKAIRFTIFSVIVMSQLCFGQEITVAAAADLQFAMQDIAARFQKETGAKVNVIYGSSGNFFQQIQNGAPFDIFFSANLDYLKQLESAGLIDPGTYYEYAKGKIIVWVGNDYRKLPVNNGMQLLWREGENPAQCGLSRLMTGLRLTGRPW